MVSYYKKSFLLLVLFIACKIVESQSSRKSRSLSRRRRYVTFPEGSSFSCAGCVTVGLIGQPAPTSTPGTFTFGLNWGLAYDLPNETMTKQLFYKRPKVFTMPVTQRRNRRDLYGKLESLMGNMGFNGRDCILKTLCETTQRIAPNGENMIEEMFRILFTLPLTKVLPFEPLEHHVYDAAHRLGVMLQNCNQYNCPLSLVDWAKGYYNAPAPTSDTVMNPWSLLRSQFGY